MIEYTVKVYGNGSTTWYLNGLVHREDGPAVEGTDNYKAWYLNGKRHRVDGPAVLNTNGHKMWYLNGERYTEEEYWKALNPVKELTVSEISKLLGYSVKIVK